MSVFVVLNDGWDEKSAILSPSIAGPFASHEEAERFLEAHPRYSSGVLEPMAGGYAGAHIVSDLTAETPDVFLTEWKEWA